MIEGHPVRLSGQDTERGTFSQRHSVLIDQENEDRYVPFNHVGEHQARFEVINSMLSEEAVVGFEYGYSLAEPNALTLWEAQFGDFANGAQVVFDQFVSSGERKWLRMSGLVCLLPHGYEGQGPEHSSARLERFLQMCAEDNMQVANCTTPANYFHILRRQLKRDIRKPLILMTPKSLLRHKRAVSRLDEMGPGTSFHRLLWDDAQMLPAEKIKLVADDKIRRVVMCSGKVYYDLYEEREKRGINDVYLLRVEQLYPVPLKALVQELGRFKTRNSCGARKSRAIWARTLSSRRISNGSSARSAPRTSSRSTPAAPPRRRRRSARCRCISNSSRRCWTRHLGSAGHRMGRSELDICAHPLSVLRPRRLPSAGTTARNYRTMADIRVPTLGESVTEATIGKWFKKPGDPVAVDEPLVELETDKVTIEVPAPAAGVLGDIAAKDGETVAVGALLGQIKEGEGAPSKTTPAPTGGRTRRPTRPRPSTRRKRSRGCVQRPRRSRQTTRGCAVGAQAGGGNRRRCLDRSGLRQGRPRDQGRHDGGDRACRRRADARSPSPPQPCRCARRRRRTMPRAKSA